MKRKLLTIALPVSFCLAAYFIAAGSATPLKSQAAAYTCDATTSHTFTYLSGVPYCEKQVRLTWPSVAGATNYTVQIMYHGGTMCPSIPSGVWITYPNVSSGMIITMPRCFSLDLNIITNCPGGVTSSPYVSGYTFCFP